MAKSQTQNPYLLIGTYTDGKSEGIHVYQFNSSTGEATKISSVASSNPSFLAVSPNKKFVYAVNENADKTGGSVSAFSFDKTKGILTPINKQPSGGKHPCYVAIDKTGKWVFAANYTSGSLAVLPVNKDGSLDTALQVIQHTGYSVNTERQEGPHVHSTVLSPDNKFLYVADLGTDQEYIYSFDKKNGELTPAKQPFVESEAGAGPRHFTFHPNNKYAYLIEEMSGNVVVFNFYKNTGELEYIQSISSQPRDFNGAIGGADIHVSPDGKFLYASNRGESNTIGIFSIDKQNGKLTWVGYQSTLGKTPRNFNFDPSGNFLLVANQNSDEVVIFSINKTTGLLTDTGKRIDVGKPVCLQWITK